MSKITSRTLILVALLLLEMSHSNILLARGGHGGGGDHEAVSRPVERSDAAPREQAGEALGERTAAPPITKDVNRQVDRDIRLDKRNNYYGVGGYDTLNQGCWTDSIGVVHCNGN